MELTTVLAAGERKPSRAGSRPSITPVRAPNGASLRILLVEDNRDTLRYLAAVLRQRGHEVVTADRCSIALAAFRDAETPFDLLLSDIELPDGTGLQLMREIKANGRMAGVAMSGFGGEEDLRQSREAGFFDHLTKPIDLNRLDEAIRRATEDDASRNASSEDASVPFSLRSAAESSGEFRIVWLRAARFREIGKGAQSPLISDYCVRTLCSELPCLRGPVTSRATPSVGKNDAHPISMISENVHKPRQARIATCKMTAANKTSGRNRGIQTRTQNDISHKAVKWVRKFTPQGCQASHVMSADWYSRLPNAIHIASPFHHAAPCNFEMPAKKYTMHM